MSGSAADLGTACHGALEGFIKAGCHLAGAGATIKTLLGFYEPEYWKVFSDTSRFDEGRIMLERWFDRMDFFGRKVLSTELKETFPLKLGDKIIPITYIWDRCDEALDGSIEVIDYKGLALNTLIPTPFGWAEMSELDKGDWVIGGNGKPCQVTAVSKVHHNPCYEITFDDSTTIIADHEHLWLVDTDKGEQLFTTEQLAENVWNNHARPQRHLRIPTVPIHLNNFNLPIDPYVLGAWLGDGNSHNGQISKPLPALYEEIVRRGYSVAPAPGADLNVARTIYRIVSKLRDLNVLKNKHIPIQYMRSSYNQRLDLLRGIMDTDGHWNPLRKRCVLVTVDHAFAEQVTELVRTLGWSVNCFEVVAKGFGLVKPAWQVWFTPCDVEVFIARRPASYRPAGTVRARQRIIKSVVEVATVPTKCIQVDSPDHTFLCGEQMVRTHNTVGMPIQPEDLKKRIQPRVYALAAAIKYPDRPAYWVSYDLLRYDVVGAKFTREDNVETYRYLQSVYGRILADDGSTERLNPECRFCVRAPVCDTLTKHVAGGGILSISDPHEAADRRALLDYAKGAIDRQIKELDEFLLAWAQTEGILEFKTDTTEVKITASSRREVDSERAAKVVGPEVMMRYGKLQLKDVDYLLKNGGLDSDTRSELKQLIRKKMTAPSVKTKPIAVVGEDE